MSKEYLVDIAVQMNIWIRPELQKKQMEILKRARPSKLIIVSDGGRNAKEWELVYANRAMVEREIDWDCEVHKLYKDKNIGIKRMIMETHEFVWGLVDKCVFLEDDIMPAVSFFQYCKDLLDKYEHDYRIGAICGMNHVGTWETSNDYFFSRRGSIWGYALWKRTYETFYRFEYEKDSYIWKLLKKEMNRDRELWKIINQIKENKETYFSPTEFFTELSISLQHQLFIIPKQNMICCEGASKNASASDSINRLPKGIRRVFFMKINEIEFPLKHPQYVIPDEKYEKKRNRIIGRNHPVISLFRRLERGFYVLKDGDFDYLWKKIKK